jgi:multiple sugar transport system permease protein
MGVPATAVAGRFLPATSRLHLVRKALVYSVLLAASALFLVPFLWSLSTSFKPLPETSSFTLLPHDWTVDAYRTVWSQHSFATYIRNSLFLAVVVTGANLFLASLGGYAFARLRFPGRELLFMLVLGTLMIPDQLRLIPVFVLLTNWHLIGNFTGYVLINLVTAVNLFFMRQYFLTIPKDYEEAAKLDGAGFFKIFWRVMLPLAGPALAAVTILQFQGTWNDFFWPLIVFGQGSPSHYTVQLGLAQFTFQYQTLWPELMAASVIALLPVLLIFVAFQRYFIAGVVAAGVKG